MTTPHYAGGWSRKGRTFERTPQFPVQCGACQLWAYGSLALGDVWWSEVQSTGYVYETNACPNCGHVAAPEELNNYTRQPPGTHD